MFTLGQTVEIWLDVHNQVAEPFTINATKKEVVILGFDKDPRYPESNPDHLRQILVEVFNPNNRQWTLSAGEMTAWLRNNVASPTNYKFEFMEDASSHFGKGVMWLNPKWAYIESMTIDVNIFTRQAQTLIRRYHPRINNKELAAAALLTVTRDVSITPREKEMLKAFAGASVPTPGTDYVWCNTCRAMIGWAEHGHCEVCRGPHILSSMCTRCSNCRAGCNCSSCAVCNRFVRRNHREEYCPYCRKCMTCCACVQCDNADGRISTCRTCTCCEQCCNCNGMSQNAGKPWEADSIKSRQLFNSKRLVGVEWEYNNSHCGYDDYNPGNPIRKWSAKWRGGIHGDGSCGLEVVTPPIAGDNIVKCLSDLGTAFKQADAKIDGRCGLHVHVDARDVTWDDMFKLLRVYAHVEPALYLLAGERRLESNYCRAAGADYMFALSQTDKKEAVISVACGLLVNKMRRDGQYNGRRTMRAHVDKKGGSRYRGLNIMPWLAGRAKKAKDTTVEFRLHKNANDSEQVIAWAKLCSRLIDFAIKSTDDDIVKLNKSAMRALCEIAPECQSYIVKTIREWRKLNKRSSRLIKFNGGKYLAPRFGCINQ